MRVLMYISTTERRVLERQQRLSANIGTHLRIGEDKAFLTRNGHIMLLLRHSTPAHA